jgi:predicted HTH transcriptional regulator
MTPLESKVSSEITEIDIQNLIGRSENQRLEFKSQEIEGYKFAKVVSGFANAEGGYIVIGANEGEHGTCKGFVSISDIGVLHQKLQQSNRNYIDEPVQAIETKDIKLPSGENLLVVHVPESPRKPHAIKKQGEQRLQFWIRSGSHNVEMKMTEIRAAFLQSAGVFDLVNGAVHDEEEDQLSDLEKEILVNASKDGGRIMNPSGFFGQLFGLL